MSNLQTTLKQWLARHDSRLDRFRKPIPISTVGEEVGERPDRIRHFLQHTKVPCYHLWSHLYRGRPSPSKPYCLRLTGPDTVGLDWEDSVVGAAEAELKRRNFQTAQDIGTEVHLSDLCLNADLSGLLPGKNLRDLWALRKTENKLELYIIEGKGKGAYEFDYYSFAETLSQVFPVPGELLGVLLGDKNKKGTSHGLCWQFAQRLRDSWRRNALDLSITVAILLPEWSPDAVWSNGEVREIPLSMYSKPLADFRKFLNTGESGAKSGKNKAQKTFGEILDHLERTCEIRWLAQSTEGLRFGLLTTRLSATTASFELAGL